MVAWEDIVMKVALVLMGLFLVYRGLRDRIAAARSERWPTVMGTVSGYSNAQTGLLKTIRADVEYLVAGKTYRHTFFSGKIMSSEEFEAAYPIGGQVTVYPNPRNPAEALVERDQTIDWIAVILGAALAGIGVLGLVLPGAPGM